MRMALLATALLATAALRPPVRSAPPMMPVNGGLTRRAALLSLPLALAASMPQGAAAICSCPTGFDSCVCTDDAPSASTTTIQKKMTHDCEKHANDYEKHAKLPSFLAARAVLGWPRG